MNLFFSKRMCFITNILSFHNNLCSICFKKKSQRIFLIQDMDKFIKLKKSKFGKNYGFQFIPNQFGFFHLELIRDNCFVNLFSECQTQQHQEGRFFLIWLINIPPLILKSFKLFIILDSLRKGSEKACANPIRSEKIVKNVVY